MNDGGEADDEEDLRRFRQSMASISVPASAPAPPVGPGAQPMAPVIHHAPAAPMQAEQSGVKNKQVDAPTDTQVSKKVEPNEALTKRTRTSRRRRK